MGLDMYLYRVTRVPKKEIEPLMGKSRDDIYTQHIHGIFIFTHEEVKEYEGDLDDLLPYAEDIEVKITYIDFDKIKNENGIDADAKVHSEYCNNERIKYKFESPVKKSVSLELKWDEIREKYSYTKTEKAYIVYLDRIAYWRKDYDLQKQIYEYLGNVKNCAYHKVPKKLFDEVLVGNSALQYSDFVDNEDSAIVYHEWY